MTEEELEKEAEEKTAQYMSEHTAKYNCENTKLETDNYNTGREYGFEDGYLAGAEPREKQIQIDAEQIRALQKDKGELTDRVKELETQIEKMKIIILELLSFEDNLDPYMYECNDAQSGELLKPFDNARDILKDSLCKKCKGE